MNSVGGKRVNWNIESGETGSGRTGMGEKLLLGFGRMVRGSGTKLAG